MAEFVTYPHAVIANGVFYPAGARVPVKTPAKAATEKAATKSANKGKGRKAKTAD